jgi:hypothetical protein
MNSSNTSPVPQGLDARLLAAAITFNCEQYERNEIDRSTWHQTQQVLWNIAVKLRIASEVLRLCAPSVGVSQ